MHQPQRLADLIPGVIDELLNRCQATHPFDDYPCARAPHGDLGHSADGTTTWTDQPDEET